MKFTRIFALSRFLPFLSLTMRPGSFGYRRQVFTQYNVFIRAGLLLLVMAVCAAPPAWAQSTNQLYMTGTAAGSTPSIIANGVDTNISMGLMLTGTGVVSVNATSPPAPLSLLSITNTYGDTLNTFSLSYTGTGGTADYIYADMYSNFYFGYDLIYFGWDGLNNVYAISTQCCNPLILSTDGLGGSNDNIIMYPHGTGQVGVGTVTPEATFDIFGYIRLAKYSAQPVACSATYDGAIALTAVYTLCTCKGSSSAWFLTSNGTTACTW